MSKADEIAEHKTNVWARDIVGRILLGPAPKSMVDCVAEQLRKAHTAGFNAAKEEAVDAARMRRFVPPVDLGSVTAADARRIADQVQQRIAAAITALRTKETNDGN